MTIAHAALTWSLILRICTLRKVYYYSGERKRVNIEEVCGGGVNKMCAGMDVHFWLYRSVCVC